MSSSSQVSGFWDIWIFVKHGLYVFLNFRWNETQMAAQLPRLLCLLGGGRIFRPLWCSCLCTSAVQLRTKNDNAVSSAFCRKAAPLDITNSIGIESWAQQSFRCSRSTIRSVHRGVRQTSAGEKYSLQKSWASRPNNLESTRLISFD